MPAEAYALIALFAVLSVIAGIGATRVVATVVRTRGIPGWRASILPIVAAFVAFYLIGHRFGISIGPEIGLFGFQVALLGDVAIAFAVALIVAAIQLVVLGRRSNA
jgi:hypothetical protein